MSGVGHAKRSIPSSAGGHSTFKKEKKKERKKGFQTWIHESSMGSMRAMNEHQQLLRVRMRPTRYDTLKLKTVEGQEAFDQLIEIRPKVSCNDFKMATL